MQTIVTATPAPERSVLGPQRVLSVDLLRGLTIALMILVNDPGDWNHIFAPLDHAHWNGWTLTDLVFPTFLFLVGASIVFSLNARVRKGDCRKTLSGHVLLRTVKILLLQFVLVFFPRMHWTTMRLYGILTRIALCYLLAGLVLIATMKLKFRARVLVGIIVFLLVGYWVLLRWVPVPGAGFPGRDIPFLDPNLNLTSWIDRGAMAWTQRWLHTGTLFVKTRDPEGLLSTLPAVASTLLGGLAGLWMNRADGTRGSNSMRRMQFSLAAAGLLAVLAGEIWSWWFPINKNLWTSSYVLLSAGLAAIVLAALSWLVDRWTEPWPRWLRAVTWPWFIFGSNAITAYAASVVLVETCLYLQITDTEGFKHTLWSLMYEKIFVFNHSNEWTSLAFAVSIVVICFLPNWWLWHKKWFIKI